NPATITNNTFQLVKLPGTPVTLNPGDVTFDQTNRIATISPSALEGNEDYTVTVKGNVVRDIAGNTMTTPYDWTFTTDAAADLTAPVLLTKAPAAGAVNVGTNTVIAMSFSKPMDISTFTLPTFSLEPTATPGPVTGNLTLIGQVVVFTPDTPLSPNIEYTATLTTGATDLTGIPMAAPVSWSFTTGAGADSNPPEVDISTVSPQPGATNVPRIGTSISVGFNEAIYPEILGTIDGIATKVVVNYDTNTVTMTPTTPLTANKDYTFRIQVRDLSRNQMTSIYAWTFTTGN
ncbi:hypothetical protein EG829_10870, partial [bacterium]|nr:hypothetical protein [bacterium]